MKLEHLWQSSAFRLQMADDSTPDRLSNQTWVDFFLFALTTVIITNNVLQS